MCQLSRLAVCMNRRETKVADVIWSATFIQQNVPISPADGAIVEVVDHRATILFTKLPLAKFHGGERVNAALGEDQVFARKRLIHHSHVVEHRLTATPRFIPVKADAPDKLCSFRIPQDRTGSLIDEIAIVIPSDYFSVGQTFSLERRSKLLLKKVAFFFS